MKVALILNITLIAFLLMPLARKAQAQNVTSSFDRTVLGTNPAAATTRGFAQVSIAHTLKTVDTKMEIDQGTEVNKLNEKINLNTSELRLTGGHAKFVPELYLGYNNAHKSVNNVWLGGEDNSTLKFIDNFLNLAKLVYPRLSIGLKLYFPSFGFSLTSPGKTQSGKKFTSNYSYHQNTLGMTVGSTLFLGAGFYVGAFANFDREEGRSKSYYLDYLTDKKQNGDDSSDIGFHRYSFGLSYLAGDSRRHGFRTEIAYSYMNTPPDNENGNIYGDIRAEEIKGAMEVAINGLSFGMTVRMLRNGYYDQSDYIQKNFIQVPASSDFTPNYGGFVALSSDKGHSFGLSGYRLPTSGKRKFQGSTGKAKSNTSVVSVSYAYLF